MIFLLKIKVSHLSFKFIHQIIQECNLLFKKKNSVPIDCSIIDITSLSNVVGMAWNTQKFQMK